MQIDIYVYISKSSRSPLGLCNLHHKSIAVQNWGFHFLDPLRALGWEAWGWGLLVESPFLGGHGAMIQKGSVAKKTPFEGCGWPGPPNERVV